MKKLIDYKDSHRDLLTVRKINELYYIFEKNEKQQGYLLYLYEETNGPGGFKKFYKEMMNNAINQEIATQEHMAETTSVLKKGIEDKYRSALGSSHKHQNHHRNRKSLETVEEKKNDGSIEEP